MLSCREETELMSQKLDRPLSFSERFGLQVHLLFCRGCRATQQHFNFLRIATGAWREHHDRDSNSH
ncbi:MAG: zf-HC2 domain-containing protein [Rugosibacter sp.]|nr:zf-HC2 domain-containing protein [Rugosibacter sp.]